MTSQPILTLLLTDPATTAIVDPGTKQAVGQQIYPKKAPQGTNPPYIVVRLSSGNHVMAIQGPDGSGSASYEVTSWATDTATADKIAAAVSARLKGFRGQVGPTGAAGTVTIKGAFETDDEEDWQAPYATDEAGQHFTRQTFHVWMTPD
jgi:Protein of unknown function (DUF3168)